MASGETFSATTEISPRFNDLLREVSDLLSPEELRHAVSSIKANFRGKFENQRDQDLYSCLRLFANQGLVSEDNLTLLEGFLSPKMSKKVSLEEKIQQFKEIRQQEVSLGEREPSLTGREHDLEKVMAMLVTGSSRVVNLCGIGGVGKTKLAMETLSKWPGRKFKADLREVTEMKDVHFHVLNALVLESDKSIISLEANPVIELIQQLMRSKPQCDMLLLLDNIDNFVGGDDEASTSNNANFVSFLQRLLGPKDYPVKSKLKILLTSRSTFHHVKLDNVYNYEVKALERVSSSALFQTQGIGKVREWQLEELLQMCQGNPLIIKGMAAILRQQIADDTKILETIEQQQGAEPPEAEVPPTEKESREREVFVSNKEGIDKEQEKCLRKMFFFLPSQQLKDCAISLSIFCRSFSVEAAAKILEVDISEAVIQLEGLRNSQLLAVDPDAEELTYDIHPLVRTFLRSIGSNQKMFLKVYEQAKGRFYEHFMSKMTEISGLLDKDCIKALERCDLDKPNFKLALDISFKSDYLHIPNEEKKQKYESLLKQSLHIPNEEKKQKYESLLKKARQSESLLEAVQSFSSIHSTAEQFSSDDNADDDLNNDDDYEDDFAADSEGENTSFSEDGREEFPEVTTDQSRKVSLQEQGVEEHEREEELDPDTIKIHEGTVTPEGVHWNLLQDGVRLAFPCNAVSEPTLLVVHRWKPAIRSPPLQEHDIVVSDVIEFSKGGQETFEFKADVNLTLTHNAPDLLGYELVVFKLLNKDSIEWEEIAVIDNFHANSDVEEGNLSAEDTPCVPSPIVQVEIRVCSTYAVVCRLKTSPVYTVTSYGGTFRFPDYPNVTLTIPKGAVTSKARIRLQMKVHEVQSEDSLLEPTLRIICSEAIEFSKPGTIQLPVSLREHYEDIPAASECRVGIMFLKSDDEREEWIETASDLMKPIPFDGRIVKCQVERLNSGYTCFRMSLKRESIDGDTTRGSFSGSLAIDGDDHLGALQVPLSPLKAGIEVKGRSECGSSITFQGVPKKEVPLFVSNSLKVTLLVDEWTSCAGGLSTFSRKLAIYLAKQPGLEITLWVPEKTLSAEHIEDARSYNIAVCEAKKRPGYDRLDWLSFPPADLHSDVVIGNGQILGRQAQFFTDRPRSSSWIQVTHTVPEQLCNFKSYPGAVLKGDEKQETELELCKLADLVVTVGPKLFDEYYSRLRSQKDKDIFRFTPGLFEEFEDLIQYPNESPNFKVLLCGRGDPEDFELKGYHLAAKAFACEELSKSRCLLLSVGATDGNQDEVAAKLLNCGISKKQLVVRKFARSRDKMRDLLCEVDLVIMPSRTEGFGLIALEALSAALPILVGSNSGFAQSIRDLPFGESCIVDSDDPEMWAKAIKSVQANHGECLSNIHELRESYREKYDWKEQCKILTEKMRTMVHESN